MDEKQDEKQILISAVAQINADNPDMQIVSVKDVLDYRVDSGLISLVMNRGVKGCPKYILTIDALPGPDQEIQGDIADETPQPKTKKPARQRSSKK